MNRLDDDLDPSLLADLDSETAYTKSSGRQKYMPRLTVDKGQSALIRLLPVTIGQNGKWFARFAQHWIGGKPYYCKRLTTEALGGNHQYSCPICALSEKYIAHTNKEVAKRAGEIAAEPRWYMVGLVFAKDEGKGAKPSNVPEPECYVAHEITLWRYQFDQLKLLAARYAVKGTAGIVDVNTGVDLWYQRSGRNTLIVPNKQAPIVKSDRPDAQEIIDRIWSSIILPNVEMPSDETVREMYAKAKEFLSYGTTAEKSSSRVDVDQIDTLKSFDRGVGGVEPVSVESTEVEVDIDPEPIARRPSIAPPAVRQSAPVAASVQAPRLPASADQTRTATNRTAPIVAQATKPATPPAASRPILPPQGGSGVDNDDDDPDIAPESVDFAPPEPLEEEPPFISNAGSDLSAPGAGAPRVEASAPQAATPQAAPSQRTGLASALKDKLKQRP